MRVPRRQIWFPRRRPWLPRLLFPASLFAAALLFALVLLSPLVDNAETSPHGWGRLLALFARDAAVRRTAIASALGLAVTAGVFFRPIGPVRRLPRKQRQWRFRQPPPPPGGAGA
jgi:hypothetical protein